MDVYTKDYICEQCKEPLSVIDYILSGRHDGTGICKKCIKEKYQQPRIETD